MEESLVYKAAALMLLGLEPMRGETLQQYVARGERWLREKGLLREGWRLECE